MELSTEIIGALILGAAGVALLAWKLTRSSSSAAFSAGSSAPPKDAPSIASDISGIHASSRPFWISIGLMKVYICLCTVNVLVVLVSGKESKQKTKVDVTAQFKGGKKAKAEFTHSRLVTTVKGHESAVTQVYECCSCAAAIFHNDLRCRCRYGLAPLDNFWRLALKIARSASGMRKNWRLGSKYRKCACAVQCISIRLSCARTSCPRGGSL